jgi:hypothetical protein
MNTEEQRRLPNSINKAVGETSIAINMAGQGFWDFE